MNHSPNIIVAAPRGIAVSNAPVILDRDDEDFIPAVLEDFRTDVGRSGLAASLASERQADQTLKLFQPIQRRFHLALIEAWCDMPGKPRVDAAKVDAAGMVLRRLRTDAQGRTVYEGWMRAGGRLRGWLAVDRMGAAGADPRPEVRLARRATGQPRLDQALTALVANSDSALLNEHVMPLFVAPPDVCAEAGRSLYYGVVQTASSELASAPPDADAAFEGFGPDSADFKDHLVAQLQGYGWYFPSGGQTRAASWFQGLFRSTDPGEQLFIRLLQQVAIEFDAFGNGSESQQLFAALQKITLTYVTKPDETEARTIAAGDFLQSAVAMLDKDTAQSSLEIPAVWPSRDASQMSALSAALFNAMKARFIAVKGRPGRFDESNARYVVRAFLRMKPRGPCPGKTLWSDYSEPFVIAPWYEGGGTPTQIVLPDLIGDRKLLKSLKPNVSFILPPALQNLMAGSAKDMLDGKQGNGNSTIGWICSFSIPVITLCAFIVLNIFLSLFDLFLGWMMSIKICIPFPKIGGK
jgi:hypothetical protein